MSAGLAVARAALAGRGAWLVGGAIRDQLLGRESADIDLVVADEPAEAARAIARAAGGAACFSLSEDYSAWRVVARDHSWQVDLERLRGDDICGDLALRDFTVNAIAEPLAGGTPIDPLDGLGDLRARRLRMAAPRAFRDDPLRVLRLVRVAVELDLQEDPGTVAAAREAAAGLSEVSPERVFVELSRILATAAARRGVELMSELGASAVVLPELEALRGVEQSRYHHLDVYGHTLEVLDRTIELTGPERSFPLELSERLGDTLGQARALLDEPLADGLTRGQALRWGALLHDAAKPATRAVRPHDGRVTFLGHDAAGADLARAVLGRLRASERLRAHVAALARHHLRLGFLVHEPQPLSRDIVFAYLRATDPVEADVTLLSVADRLATRGAGSAQAIDAHLALAAEMLADALRWRMQGPPRPLLRGDELARELGIAPGPRLGALLEELARAQFVGEVRDRAQALSCARGLAKTI